MSDVEGGSLLPRRILAAVALSPRAVAVAREAARLASELGADLTLLHAGAVDEATRGEFEAVLREAGMEGCPTLFRAGRADQIICAAAEELESDLIVLGASEQEGVLGYYLGSVARRVARCASCSVLLLPQPRRDPRPFGFWVVAVEFTPRCLEMLAFMANLARPMEPRKVDVLSEYDTPGAGLAIEGDLDQRSAEEVRDRIHRAERTRLAEFLSEADIEGLNVRPVCLRGREGWESAQYARREGADLLLAAAPRRVTFWNKVFRYGVEFALESLPCALWLYRRRQDDRSGG